MHKYSILKSDIKPWLKYSFIKKYGIPTQYVDDTLNTNINNTLTTVAGKIKNFKLHANLEQATSILPDGYTQVDYIESSGTQYINTNYSLQSNQLEIKTKIYVPTLPITPEQDILSNQDDSTNRVVFGIFNSYFFGYSRSGTGASTSDPNVVSDDLTAPNIFDIQLTYDYTNHVKSLSVNNNITVNDYYKAISPSNNKVVLFRDSAKSVSYFVGKLYYMILKVDNDVVFNFIPCYRNSDNEVGLYDLVSNTFYTNSGTGAFTYGSVVNIPNPDFPQDIKVLTGDINVKVKNKNLFDYTKHSALALDNNGRITTTKYYTSDTLITYKLKPNTKYTFSFRNSNYELSNHGLAMSINGSWVQTNQGKYTVTTDNNGEFTAKIGAESYPNVGKASLYIQLEEGTTATQYTPHQEQSLPLNLPVENLFDKNNFTCKDYYGMVDGEEVVASSSGYTTSYIKVEPNTKYTISGKLNTSSSRSLRIYFYTSAKTWIDRTTNYYQSEIPVVFTTPNNCYYIQFQYGVEGTDFNTVQIEKGDIAHPYNEYGKALEYCKIPNTDYKDEFMKPTGKNIFNKNNSTMIERIYAYIPVSQSGSYIWNYAQDSYSIRIPCKTNTTYTISANNPNVTVFRAGVTDSENIPQQDGNSVALYSVQRETSTSTPLTVLTGENAKYIIVQISASLAVDTFETLQIEEGNIATQYEPYGNGEWYLKKNVGKTVLDGSEDEQWVVHSSSTGTLYRYWLTSTAFVNIIDDIIISSETLLLNKVLCNIEKQDLFAHTEYGKFGINTSTLSSSWILFNFDNSEISDLTKFRNYLSINNAIVYYPLASSKYILLNDTLQEQLNNIENTMRSYKGQTNIIVETNIDTTFDLSYKTLAS